ncbi:MAG: hypothetical protein IJG38_05075 [Thermoguttaceae bacterium]|nr:hypothetical protein [Thermoguttaceae bacterium]
MGENELVILIKKAKSILRSKLPKTCSADLEDAIQFGLLRYLEKYGTIDTLTVAWLVLTANRRLIDVHRHDSKSVSLPSSLITDGDEAIVDLAIDNPDLCGITANMLFPK